MKTKSFADMKRKRSDEDLDVAPNMDINRRTMAAVTDNRKKPPPSALLADPDPKPPMSHDCASISTMAPALPTTAATTTGTTFPLVHEAAAIANSRAAVELSVFPPAKIRHVLQHQENQLMGRIPRDTTRLIVAASSLLLQHILVVADLYPPVAHEDEPATATMQHDRHKSTTIRQDNHHPKVPGGDNTSGSQRIDPPQMPPLFVTAYQIRQAIQSEESLQFLQPTLDRITQYGSSLALKTKTRMKNASCQKSNATAVARRVPTTSTTKATNGNQLLSVNNNMNESLSGDLLVSPKPKVGPGDVIVVDEDDYD